MTIKSKRDMPSLKSGSKSSYAHILPQMMALDPDEEYIELPVPEGCLPATERNKLYNLLKLHAPVPPKGYTWKAGYIEDQNLQVVFLQKGETGHLGSWAKGGKTPYDGSW